MHTTQSLRVLVLDTIHKSGLDVLRHETEVTVLPGLSGDVLATAIGDYHAIIVNSDTNLTTQLINRAHQLQVIGVVGARLDRIDVHTAYAHNIEIVDVHNYAANAVAEQTLRLLLGLNVPLAGHTLGIIGFGRTGSEVARRARAFDMRIVANHPLPTLELAITDDVEMLNLPNLLAQADFISLHVPGQPTTPALLTGEHLAHLKPGAYFLNLSCSNLIDPAALLAALDDDRLAGAVLTAHPDDTPLPKALRAHARMQLVPPVEATADKVEHDIAVTLAQRVLQALRTYKSGNQLNLKIAPIERVLPHEHYDPERVAALAARLANEETLINPPVVVQTEDHYIVLDGATRSQAFRQLGYPHVAVQVVDPDDDGLELYHWNHALSDVTTAQLLGRLQQVGEMQWEKTDKPTAETMLSNRKALCYLVTPDEQCYLALADEGATPIAVLNEIVAAYTRLGCTITRTRETTPAALQAPKPAGIVIFPQFSIDEVLRAGIDRTLLPAGITRFVISGRVLRLHASLERLRAEVPLARKQAWLDKLIAAKVYSRQIRYYQEPVLLLDE